MALTYTCPLCRTPYDARININRDIAYNFQEHEVTVGNPDDPCDSCSQRINAAKDKEEEKIKEEAATNANLNR